MNNWINCQLRLSVITERDYYLDWNAHNEQALKQLLIRGDTALASRTKNYAILDLCIRDNVCAPVF